MSPRLLKTNFPETNNSGTNPVNSAPPSTMNTTMLPKPEQLNSN